MAAAALHVGLLPKTQKPSKQVLLSLPYFDTQKSDDHGILQFVGNCGEDLVFSVGMETEADHVIKALKNLFALANEDMGQVKFIKTMPVVNRWMKMGGVASRVFGLKGIGRPLVTYGLSLAFADIVQLVDEVSSGSEREI